MCASDICDQEPRKVVSCEGCEGRAPEAGERIMFERAHHVPNKTFNMQCRAAADMTAKRCLRYLQLRGLP